MNLKNYSPKDARLLKDNEGKTPDELLVLGLSQRGYRRLLEDNIAVEQSNSATLQPLSVESVNLKAGINMFTWGLSKMFGIEQTQNDKL